MRSQGTRLGVLVGGIVAAAALAWAPAAVAGDPFAVKVAEKKGGPYGEEVIQGLDTGEKDTFYVRVANKAGGATLFLTLYATLSNPQGQDFKARWFRGDKEITDAVVAQNHEFTLKRTKVFTVTVRSKSNNLFCIGTAATDGMNADGISLGFNDNNPCT